MTDTKISEEVFVKTVEEAKNLFYYLAYSILLNEQDAEDAVSEMILNTWERRSHLRDPKKLKRWMQNTVLNIAKTMLKKKKQFVLYDRIPESSYEEETDDLWSLLVELDVKERTVIYMRYYEGYSQKEIGEILHIPEGTVKSRLHKAKKNLRKIMGGIRNG